MLFKTETSIYRLTIADPVEVFAETGVFDIGSLLRLEKVSLLPGKQSSIQPGEVFFGSEVRINNYCMSLFWRGRVEITTSPIDLSEDTVALPLGQLTFE